MTRMRWILIVSVAACASRAASPEPGRFIELYEVDRLTDRWVGRSEGHIAAAARHFAGEGAEAKAACGVLAVRATPAGHASVREVLQELRDLASAEAARRHAVVRVAFAFDALRRSEDDLASRNARMAVLFDPQNPWAVVLVRDLDAGPLSPSAAEELRERMDTWAIGIMGSRCVGDGSDIALRHPVERPR